MVGAIGGPGVHKHPQSGGFGPGAIRGPFGDPFWAPPDQDGEGVRILYGGYAGI